MYVFFKFAMLDYAMLAQADWRTVFMTIWTDQDFGLLMMVLTFWFIGRTIEKRERRE
jgi:hypothetical protein